MTDTTTPDQSQSIEPVSDDKLTIIPPEDVRVLKNGAWMDKKTGRIMKAAPNSLWDSKKASEVAKKRHAMTKKKVREGIVAAVQASERPGSDLVRTAPQAAGVIAQVLISDIVLNERANEGARVKASEFVFKTADLVEEQKNTGLPNLGSGNTINILMSTDTALAAKRLLSEDN
jgi:hypothetical protein